MAVRTVSVLLTADIAAFRARMGEASRTANRTSADIRTAMRNAGRTMVSVGQNQRQALKMVQGASLGLVAAFGFAVAASAKFEKAMSNVKAVTRANATQMGQLRASALEAGRTTAFSAVQAAEAQHELAKAGVSVSDIAGGALKGALNLAAAAEINVAEGAEIAANAMVVFGLKGKDVGHVADVLAAAANKSTTDVHAMGLSLRMAGQVASQTGLSLEDTVGALTLFAAEGLKGSDAGTSFKVMLQRLTPQSKEAQAAMDKLGFTAYDSQGNFVGLQETSRRLKESFSGLTPEARNAAMGVIFGSDAVRAANILYKHGAEGVRTYTDAVNDQGYAQAVAMTRMDNLIGDFKLLRAALESALIETGSAANSALRDMVQWVTRLINIYNGLPPGLQQTVGVMTGLVGVIGLAGASMLLLLPRIMLVRRELQAMGVTAAVARTQLMLLGKLGLTIGVLAGIGYGVSKMADQFAEAPPKVDALTQSMKELAQTGQTKGELTEAFGKDLDELGESVARIAHPSVLKRVKDFFSTFDPFSNTDLDRSRKDIEAVDQALAQLVSSGSAKEAQSTFKALAEVAEEHGTSTEKFLTLLPGYAEALATTNQTAMLTAEAEGQLGDATATTADEMADQRTAAEKLSEALDVLNGAAITAAEGQIGFEQSLDDLREAVKENGTTLDVTTEKGRAVKSAFLDAAKSAQDYAQSVADQKGSVEAGNAVLETNIAALKRTMKQVGFTDKKIEELIGTYAQLPPKTATEVKAETEGAMRDLEAVQKKVKNTKGKTVTVSALTKEGQRQLEALGFKIKRTKGKRVEITVPTGTQQSAVRALAGAIASLRDRSIRITTEYRIIGKPGGPPSGSYYGSTVGRSAQGGPVRRRYASGGMVLGFPDGGAVFGPGSSTSDSIPTLLSNGEYVIKAAAVSKYGLAMFDALNAMRLASGGAVGLAKGGKAKKKTPQSVLNARREVPGDLGALGRALNDSASDIRSASNALITDLKKLGNAGWHLAKRVDATSRKLQDLANRRDKVSERIAEAKSFARSTTGDVKDFLGVEGGGSAKSVIKQMQDEQQTAGKFKADIANLRKRGLNKTLLAQVIAEGPEGQLAHTLLSATQGEMKQLNALAGKGSKLAKSIGNLSADALYDAGKNASKGFLAGLKAEEKALQKQMDKLGQDLIKAIKKALKIHSPSARARDEVGKMFGRGVAQGVALSTPGVQAAAHRMSAAAISAAYTRPAAPAAAAAGGGQFSGNLYLESGQFLGAVKGTVEPLIRDSEQRQAYRARVGRR
ncbi:phage tail tape measure protein [Streptomyces luteolifulvus]|uniref:Phage tail tape measure protein n=1 Tax=Streptomyces luteolifulvus TaxID=2615112 RepID=A0A6H9V2H3_9ACTN|nr:phage tail tape measure protein [Streptomyces luteolifulvus]KAB1146833.1 phage tail tape measure protein [Streptomyces luteolifulvus]